MWIKGLSKKHGIEIKRIRLDNSGENKSLQKECNKENLGVIFEFTAPGTPHQNSVAERIIPSKQALIQKEKENFGVKSFPQQQSWITLW